MSWLQSNCLISLLGHFYSKTSVEDARVLIETVLVDMEDIRVLPGAVEDSIELEKLQIEHT